VDYRGQGAVGVAAEDTAAFGAKKKAEAGLLERFEKLWWKGCEGFSQERVWRRAQILALSTLVCLGRHTVTGLVAASGRQFQDWSADYRLFSKDRFDADALFRVVRRGVIAELPQGSPLVVAMDDSLLPKRGMKMAGVAYRRDPLGPPFQVNFIRAQRVLQLSAALPTVCTPASARMIPIGFLQTPTPKRPRAQAAEELWQEYRRVQQQMNISRRGAEQLSTLRDQIDGDDKMRPLWVVVDGRFTNGTILKNLPERTVLIGRVRQDTKLYYLPWSAGQSPLGRKRVYGDRAPTPEQLRQDTSVPWSAVRVWAAGKVHAFRVKTLSPLRWRSAGMRHDLRLIVIAPLAYRPRKGSRLLYRKPAYLIATDTNVPLQQIIQAYVWRWDIEVNFRDEKTILGVGQAQVRKPSSVQNVPQLMVAAYAIMLLAAHQTFPTEKLQHSLPPPKWRRQEKPQRVSTQKLINHLRAELWGKAMGITNFSGFLNMQSLITNPKKTNPDLCSAVLYASA
jgi:hypothetical protein